MKNQITKGKVDNSIIEAEAEANAELIAEAFNVTNESGFTPSELLAQRNELLEIVKKICVYKDKSITENYTDLLKLIYAAQAAINNTTK